MAAAKKHAKTLVEKALHKAAGGGKAGDRAVRAFQALASEPTTPPDAELTFAKTQLERAAVIVRRLDAIPGLEEAARALDAVVGEAQNDPPIGAADGTIHVPLWNTLRYTADTLHKLTQLLSHAVMEIDIGEVRARHRKLRR